MLKAVQQQSLFNSLSPSQPDGRKFIEVCSALDATIVVSSRDTRAGYEGNTLLHESARIGCPEAVLHLIEIGHTVDCIDTSLSKITPLLVAIQANKLEVVEILMRSGASLFHIDIRGDNALHYGARIGSRMCKLLLRHPELSPFDYRSLLATENIKLQLPVELAVNPFIEKLFTSMGGRNISRLGPRKPKKSKDCSRVKPETDSNGQQSSSIAPESVEVSDVNSNDPQPEQKLQPDRYRIVRLSLIDILNTEFFGRPVSASDFAELILSGFNFTYFKNKIRIYMLHCHLLENPAGCLPKITAIRQLLGGQWTSLLLSLWNLPRSLKYPCTMRI